MRQPLFAIAAALTLGATLSALPAQMAGAQSPSTSVLVPSSGATLSGSTYLDASAANATSVEFLLFGGSYGYSAPVVCTATLTYYGWICAWNTTTVPNSSYALVSYASGAGGSAYSSSGVSITVNNPPPSTTVLFPASAATLDLEKGFILDAGASPGVATVSFKLTVIGFAQTFAAILTIDGWIASVPPQQTCPPDCSPEQPPGSTVQSVASYSGGVSGTSPPVNVTVIAYIPTPP